MGIINIKEELKKILKDCRIDKRKLLYTIDKKHLEEISDFIYFFVNSEIEKRLLKYDELGIFKIFDFLSEREREILRQRFIERKTLEKVSKDFGTTRERIRQLEERALEKIKYISLDK